MRSRADRAFARYRSSGDPRAVAIVFDRTAPELLRLALHLTRDPHRAEDALQSTFLSAMENAEGYDPDRPVLPWLSTILANHVRQSRRRERRAVRLPGRADVPTDRDIGDAAADREAAGACDRALDALPEPYRHVLILHLRHELSAVEIARAHDRPSSTVRNQIARGLTLLRRALPASAISATVVGTASGPVLAAVRAEVIAAVGRMRPVAAAGAGTLTLIGVTMFEKSLGFAAAAVVAALALPFGWQWLVEDAPTTPLAQSPALTGSRLPSQTPPTPTLDHAEEPVVRGPVADSGSLDWSVQGHIDGTRGGDAREPISGALVGVVAMRGELRHELGSAATDANGRFRIGLGGLHELSPIQRETAKLLVWVEADGWIPASFQPEDPTPTEPRSITVDGTLAPIRGVLVGRAVDPVGRSVPNASVFWKRLDPRRRPFQGRDFSGSTKADGTFRLHFDEDGEYLLAVGSWASGYGCRPLARCTADGVHDVGDVMLKPFSTVAGRFVMQDGTPLARFWYDIRHLDNRSLQQVNNHPRPTLANGAVQPIRYMSGETDDDGRFHSAVLEPGRYLVRVRDRFWTAQEFEVGTDEGEHQLVLEGQLLTVSVFEPGTGPLPGAGLGATVWSPGRAPDLAQLSRGLIRAEDGLSSARGLDALDAATTILTPWDAVWEFRASLPGAVPQSVLHRAERGVSHANIGMPLETLDRHGNIELSVVDERGDPVRPFEASLLFPASGGLAAGRLHHEEAERAMWHVPPGEWLLRVRPGRTLLCTRTMSEHCERVTVVADATTRVQVIAQRMGLVRIRLDSPMPPEESWQQVQAILDDGTGLLPLTTEKERTGIRQGARLMVEQADGWLGIPHLSIPVGSRALLQQPVRPGRVMLTVTASGYLPTTQAVEVAPDTITDVAVLLHSK